MANHEATTSTSRRTRVLTFLDGCTSLFNLWPVVKYEDVYPYKANDVFRRSMERVSAAYWTAFREVTGEQEEGEATVEVSGALKQYEIE